MIITNKILFIIVILIVFVCIILINETNENFNNSTDNNNNNTNIKKSKTLKSNKSKKSDKNNNYSDLEIKVLTDNSDYKKLTDYLKKYTNNFLYNLENINYNLPLIITYDNESIKNTKNESFVNFLKGIVHYKYNFIICGINTKWDGWYGRFKSYLELLDTIPPDQLIFVTDSRDVLVNDSPVEFYKNYLELTSKYNDLIKNKIIFGTEVGCCVNQMWHYPPGSVFNEINQFKTDKIKNEIKQKVLKNNLQTSYLSNDSKTIKLLDKIEIEENNSPYNNDLSYGLQRNLDIFPNGKTFPWDPWIKWNNFFKDKFIEANTKYNLDISDNKYPLIKLNFGMMVGCCKDILKMLRLFDMRPGEDDQHLASEFFYSRPEMVILDYTQILLSNTGYKHSFRKCTSNTMNNTYYNVNFNDHLNDHDEYIDFNVYTREDIPEQGIMYGFDIENLKYFFTYDNIINWPCFIQSPGKDWNCYNELLYRFPYCDNKMCSYYYNLERTHKYNIRDIIIHEYKNQLGTMNIEWILTNLLNPLYWALNLYILKDIYQISNELLKDSETFILIDSGTLMGYHRFGNLDQTNIMSWDDDIDIGWYSNEKFTNKLIDLFFKQLIKKGYEIFVYYKEKNSPYSSAESDHYTIRISSNNILQIPDLLEKYELVLFNIAIGENKYLEILKIFNMDDDYEEKYIDGEIKIPSVDVFMYEYDKSSNAYEYKKLFGAGYVISIDKKNIGKINTVKFNKLDVNVPENIKDTLDSIYSTVFYPQYNNFDVIKIKRHIGTNDDQKLINNFNEQNIKVSDTDIILITKIYNNFINKYYEIINSNDTIKKIINGQ